MSRGPGGEPGRGKARRFGLALALAAAALTLIILAVLGGDRREDPPPGEGGRVGEPERGAGRRAPTRRSGAAEPTAERGDAPRECAIALTVDPIDGCASEGRAAITAGEEREGAPVAARWSGGRPLLVQGIACGWVEVEIEADGCLSGRISHLVDQLIEPISFALQGGATIHLAVSDASSGAPIAGAEIQHPTWKIAGRTDARGRIAAAVGPALSSRYVVQAEGYAPGYLRDLVAPEEGQEIPVELWPARAARVRCWDGDLPCDASTAIQVYQTLPEAELQTRDCSPEGEGAWTCLVSSQPDSASLVSATSDSRSATELAAADGETLLRLPSHRGWFCLDRAEGAGGEPCYASVGAGGAQGSGGIDYVGPIAWGQWTPTEVEPMREADVAVFCVDSSWVGSLEVRIEPARGCLTISPQEPGQICAAKPRECRVQSDDPVVQSLIVRRPAWEGGCSAELPAGAYTVNCAPEPGSDGFLWSTQRAVVSAGEVTEIP